MFQDLVTITCARSLKTTRHAVATRLSLVISATTLVTTILMRVVSKVASHTTTVVVHLAPTTSRGRMVVLRVLVPVRQLSGAVTTRVFFTLWLSSFLKLVGGLLCVRLGLQDLL